jgi:hypothetical protein
MLAGCGQYVPITLHNNSAYDLTSIVLTGSGFTDTLQRLPAGGTGTLEVKVRGESGLEVAFEADTFRIDASPEAYFEASGRYRVTVVIDSMLALDVKSTLR